MRLVVECMKCSKIGCTGLESDTSVTVDFD
jgi:hypothetical protein